MNKPKWGEFCWNELATSDINTAKDFYQQLLGWKFTEHETGDHVYSLIQQGDNTLGGIWQVPKEQANQVPPHWMGYILVDDLEATLQKATSMGATVKMPITPVGEIGSFMVIADPTGAHIAFWQSKNGHCE